MALDGVFDCEIEHWLCRFGEEDENADSSAAGQNTMALWYVADGRNEQDCWVEYLPHWFYTILATFNSTATLHNLVAQSHGSSALASIQHCDRLFVAVANVLSIILSTNIGVACGSADLLASVPPNVVVVSDTGAQTCCAPTRYSLLALWYILHARTLACTSSDPLAVRFVRLVDSMHLGPTFAFCHAPPGNIPFVYACHVEQDKLNQMVSTLVLELTATMQDAEYHMLCDTAIEVRTAHWVVRCTCLPAVRHWRLICMPLSATVLSQACPITSDMPGSSSAHARQHDATNQLRLECCTDLVDMPGISARANCSNPPNYAFVQAYALEQASLLRGLADILLGRLEKVSVLDSWKQYIICVTHHATQLGDVCDQLTQTARSARTRTRHKQVPEASSAIEPKLTRVRARNKLSASRTRLVKTIAGVQSELLCAVQYWLTVLLADEHLQGRLLGMGGFARGHVLSWNNQVAFRNLFASAGAGAPERAYCSHCALNATSTLCIAPESNKDGDSDDNNVTKAGELKRSRKRPRRA